MPNISADALSWLASTRRPGVWATVPKLEGSGRLEPLLAHYDLRARAILQRQTNAGNYRFADVASHPKIISPTVPAQLAAAWKNVNAAADLAPEGWGN